MTDYELEQLKAREVELENRRVREWFRRKFHIANMSDITTEEMGETCRAWIKSHPMRFAEPGKAWAERLRDAEAFGDVLTPLQSRMWREALGANDADE